jgi:hypothetical protein
MLATLIKSKMKSFLLFCFFLLNISFTGFGFEKHALLIGIDEYSRPSSYRPANTTGRKFFENLYGCKNDVNSIYSIITSRFNFNPQHIDTLLDRSATRNGILKALDTLLQKANEGDVVFIFYAGHGSYVKNSKSFEVDKKDQTIVPSDTWFEGVSDIRDKELSTYFNKFLDKNIKLTVIFDCCHSGSITRGPNLFTGTLRYMPTYDWDSKDSTKSVVPEKRPENNFLIFSSAQSDEPADEEDDDEGNIHGAFTLALIEAINQQSVGASAENLFLSARAILKSYGKLQEPIIGGSIERQQQTLFGFETGNLSAYSLISVSGTVADTSASGIIRKRIRLQGGTTLGIYKESELAMINTNNDTLFIVRVDSVLGITKSLATVLKGDIDSIKPGYQFQIINWVSNGKPLLKLFLPLSSFSDSDVFRFTEIAQELKRSPNIKWQSKIGKGFKDPYTSVFWIDTVCYIKVDTSSAVELKIISTETILSYCKNDSSLYMELPVSKNTIESVYEKLFKNKNLKLVSKQESAHYIFFGRLGERTLPVYGFRKKYIAVKDSLESLPNETDCFELDSTKTRKPTQLADNLYDRAVKISKIRGWLSLASPDATKKSIGYHLEIFNIKTNKKITNREYFVGDSLQIKLVSDKDLITTDSSKLYFVYVFSIDQSGAMVLLYPTIAEADATNKFPKKNGNQIVKEVIIVPPYKLQPPTGTDNFFLLASLEPIKNPKAIFNQTSVNSDSGPIEARDRIGLSDLLNLGNDKARSGPGKLKADWSLQKYSFRCMYR